MKVTPLPMDELTRRYSQELPSPSAIGPAPLPRVPMPSETDVDQLLDVVHRAYPVLLPRSDDVGYRQQIVRALFYLMFARRVSEPSTAHFFTFWLDQCEQFLRERGFNGVRVNIAAFTTAIVASGVSFYALDTFPTNISFGLALGQANKPSTGWRDVLRSGQVPPPTARRTPLPLDNRPMRVIVPSREERLRPGRVE